MVKENTKDKVDRFIHLPSADDQHPGTAQVLPGHVQSVLVFLGHLLVNEVRQEQQGAYGREPGFIHLPAIIGGVLPVCAPDRKSTRLNSSHR